MKKGHVNHRARIWLHTIDPSLAFTNLLWRMAVAMTCVFVIPYFVGPLFHLPPKIALGSAGGLMGVAPQIVAASSRRDALQRCVAGMIGVFCGSLLMTALFTVTWLQVIIFVIVMTLPSQAGRIHSRLGQTTAQALMNSSLMMLLMGRYIDDIWGYWPIYIVMACLVIAAIGVFMVAFARRPRDVLRSAMFSLLIAHEEIARCCATALRSGTISDIERMDRAISRGHRATIVQEAAMAGIPGYPTPLGQHSYHSSYDVDLSWTRLARVIRALAPLNTAAAMRIRRRIAEICDLLTQRDPNGLALATELAGGLTHSVRGESLAMRTPYIMSDLIVATIKGGIAAADGQEWLKAEYTYAATHRPFHLPAALALERAGDTLHHHQPPWAPARSRAQLGHDAPFSTGTTYNDLRHSGETDAAIEAAGTLRWGKLAITLHGRHIIQTLVAVAAATVIGWGLSGVHFFWASFGAFVVLIGTTTTSSRIRKTLRRTIGSAVGALAGLAITLATGNTHPSVTLIVIVSVAALAFTVVSRNYTLFTTLLTTTVMQLYLITASPILSYALLRVVENIIGAITAALVASFIFPLHTSSVVRKVLQSLHNAIDDLLSDTLHIIDGDISGVHPRMSARHVEDAASDVHALATALLSGFGGSSGTWVRQVASRVPSVAHTAALVGASAGEIMDGLSDADSLHTDPLYRLLHEEESASLRKAIENMRQRSQSLGIIRDPHCHEPLHVDVGAGVDSGTGTGDSAGMHAATTHTTPHTDTSHAPAARPESSSPYGAENEFPHDVAPLLRSLHARADNGNAEADTLITLIHELATLDESIRSLVITAWGH